jgi:hypothetical protein
LQVRAAPGDQDPHPEPRGRAPVDGVLVQTAV